MKKKTQNSFESPIKSDERVFIADTDEPTAPSSSIEEVLLNMSEKYKAGTKCVVAFGGSLRYIAA